MKYLSILRHGKSCWENTLPDIARPLADRGLQAIHNISQFWKFNLTIPEILISSHAERCLQTANIVHEILQIPLEIDSFWYGSHIFSNPWNMLKKIQNTANQWEHIGICGHNPGLLIFCNFLIRHQNIQKLPTGTVIQIEFDKTNWHELSGNSGDIMAIIKPKELI